MFKGCFLCVYPSWSLKCFLNPWLDIFLVLENFWPHFFKYVHSFSPSRTSITRRLNFSYANLDLSYLIIQFTGLSSLQLCPVCYWTHLLSFIFSFCNFLVVRFLFDFFWWGEEQVVLISDLIIQFHSLDTNISFCISTVFLLKKKII